jgi:hypothetical protein
MQKSLPLSPSLNSSGSMPPTGDAIAIKADALPEPSSRGNTLLLSLAILMVLIEVIPTLLGGYGYFIDEWYYIACANRLAFGFADLRTVYAQVDSVGIIRGKYGMSWRNNMTVYLAKEPTTPLNAVWDRIKHYE